MPCLKSSNFGAKSEFENNFKGQKTTLLDFIKSCETKLIESSLSVKQYLMKRQMMKLNLHNSNIELLDKQPKPRLINKGQNQLLDF